MKIKLEVRQKIIVGLIILALLWAGNITFYFNQQLEQPLFLNHRYELSLDESWSSTFLPLFYLANRTVDRQVVQIRFLSTDRDLRVSDTVFSTFRHQSLRYLYVRMQVFGRINSWLYPLDF